MKNQQKTPLVAVRAIIFDENNRILLLRRAPDDEYGNQWCLPGGKVDLGQTAEEAMAREIDEETSLECTAARFLFYQDGLPQFPGEKHYLSLYFECRVTGEIELNEESSEFAWIAPGELDGLDIAFGNNEAIARLIRE